MASIGGRMSLPYLSPYHASKFAIEGIGDSLRQEMRPFGVNVSIIEPGAIATPFWGKGTEQVDQVLETMNPGQRELYEGSARAAAAAAGKAGERGIEPDPASAALPLGARRADHCRPSSAPFWRGDEIDDEVLWW